MDENSSSYQDRVTELGSRKLDGLTVAEAFDLFDQYNQAMRAAQNYAFRQQRQAPPVQNMLQNNRPAPIKTRKKFDEISIGRYVMTIVAALLCLLGVSVFAAGFWPSLPEFAKYMVLNSIGSALWVLGYIKSKGPMRPFWLGCAGLGSGVVFLDFILGAVNYNLYGLLGGGVLCLIWTCACFAVANKTSAWLFYIIAYLGGFITFVLAGFASDNFDGGFLACGICAVILTVGAVAWYSGKKHWALAVFWLAGCYFMGFCLKFMGSHDFVTGVCRITCGVLACGAIWFAAKTIPDFWKDKKSGQVCMAALAFINAFFVRSMAMAFFNYHENPANILAAGILISGTFIAPSGYITGVAVPIAVSIFGPGELFGVLVTSVCGLLPAIASRCSKYRAKIDRAGLFLIWLAFAGLVLRNSGSQHYNHTLADFMPNTGVWTYVLVWLGLTAGLIMWAAFRHSRNDWSAGHCSRLVILCAGLYAFMIPCEVFGLPGWVFVCVSGVVLNSFRRFYVGNKDCDIVTKTVTVFLCFLSACALSSQCVYGHVFHDDTNMFGDAALTATLFLIAAMDVYGMIRSSNKLQGVLACLAANWCMLMSTHIWLLNARVFTSAAGIIISACFVYAGFKLDKKYVRMAGLGCALLYALKLGLYDMSFSGGLGMSAGLLLSGLGCFGISFLYNKLNKALKNSDIGSDMKQ